MSVEVAPIDLSHIKLPPLARRKRLPKRAIRQVVQAIAKRFNPEKIILFGSYAYGDPKPWSDVDLLLVMETELTERAQRLLISRAINAPFRIEVLVRTPANLKKRLNSRDYFLQEIVSKGQVVYERRS